MSHTRSLDFPQELVDTVIDNLKGDRTALRAASLVGRAWCHRTRAHLFHSISIHFCSSYRNSMAQWVNLAEVLESRSLLGDYVKTFTITRYSAEEWFEPYTAAIVKVFSLLPAVSNFILSSCGRRGDGLDWALVPHQVQAALANFLASPTLKSLQLRNIDNFDAVVLLNCHSLEDIRLETVETKTEQATASAKPTTPAQTSKPYSLDTPNHPTRLFLSSSSGTVIQSLLEQGSCTGSIFRPTVIILDLERVGKEMVRYLPTFLGACAGTVEDLHVFVGDWHPGFFGDVSDMEPWEIFKLPTLPNLRTFGICLSYQPDFDYLAKLVESLQMDFVARGAQTMLSKLRIDIGIDADEPYEPSIDLTLDIVAKVRVNGAWTELDRMLLHPRLAFPHLEKVEFVLTSEFSLKDHPDWESILDDAKGDILSKMPRLCAAGLVEMRIINRYGDDS